MFLFMLLFFLYSKSYSYIKLPQKFKEDKAISGKTLASSEEKLIILIETKSPQNIIAKYLE